MSKKTSTKAAPKKNKNQSRIADVYAVNVNDFINEAKNTIDEAKIEEFKERVIIFDPVEIETKKATNVYSKGYYKNDKGEPANLVILGTEQDVWFSASWPYGMPEKDRKLEKVIGFTASYPLNSKTTVEKPTLKEKVLRRLLDILAEKGQTHVAECFKKKLSVIPTPSSGSFMKHDGDMDKVVKPFYVEGRVDEKTKEKASDFMWVKLETYGQGSDLKCTTELFGPGDKPMHPFAIINAPANEKWGRFIKLSPALRWEGLFWGDHKTSGFGASHRLTLYQGSYVPTASGGVNRVRLLAPNSTPSAAATPNVEDKDFDDETKETQADKLKAAGKKSPAVVTSTKAPKKTVMVSKTVKKPEPEKKPPMKKKVVEEEEKSESEGEAESE